MKPQLIPTPTKGHIHRLCDDPSGLCGTTVFFWRDLARRNFLLFCYFLIQTEKRSCSINVDLMSQQKQSLRVSSTRS